MKIIILSGSPKKDGNTAIICDWLSQAARKSGAQAETVAVAFLKAMAHGCTSCRACQKSDKYECVIKDQISDTLKKMAAADVIVMATPMYFIGPSAQLKHVIDRMFALYKWDNRTGSMKTILKGKKLVLVASCYEPMGMEALEAPFRIIAEYTGMRYDSLLIPGAGTSGQVKEKQEIKEKVLAFGERIVN